ncbi:hypothetical protein [Leptospira gomenensis]|uniref:hypothetical protein n=1 Tax=Leptospira gomenensis TaxID=2484974 RepID=UPI001438401C|nr:hypothetical protein [Leptospira gomenensis]
MKFRTNYRKPGLRIRFMKLNNVTSQVISNTLVMVWLVLVVVVRPPGPRFTL